MAFKIPRLCPASLYTEMAKSALFSFFWVPSFIAMQNFRNGMVLKKTMSRAMLFMFPTHFHQAFFRLSLKIATLNGLF